MEQNKNNNYTHVAKYVYDEELASFSNYQPPFSEKYYDLLMNRNCQYMTDEESGKNYPARWVSINGEMDTDSKMNECLQVFIRNKWMFVFKSSYHLLPVQA